MPTPPPASRAGGLAKRARHLGEAAIFGALSAVVGVAPARARYAIGTGLGTLYWAIDARHRRVALSNLRLAYGDTLAPAEIARLARGSMQHFARVAVEALAMPRYLDDSLESPARIEGLDHLRAAQARGRGVIWITGHLGYWELAAFMLGRLGFEPAGLVRPLDNPYLEARLSQLRSLSGNRPIDKRGGLRASLGVLRAGGLLTLLIDQRPKRGGIKVPFFGADVYVTEGLAVLALRSEAAVVPGFAVREPDGSLRLVFEPEIPVARAGQFATDSYRISADCTAILERWVRHYPDQWLWSHRRWAVPTLNQAPADGPQRAA